MLSALPDYIHHTVDKQIIPNRRLQRLGEVLRWVFILLVGGWQPELYVVDYLQIWRTRLKQFACAKIVRWRRKPINETLREKIICDYLILCIRVNKHIGKRCCRYSDVRRTSKRLKDLSDQLICPRRICLLGQLSRIDRCIVSLIVNKQQRPRKRNFSLL